MRYLSGSDEPLCTAYSLALLDLDGVVYRGGAAVGPICVGMLPVRGGGCGMDCDGPGG